MIILSTTAASSIFNSVMNMEIINPEFAIEEIVKEDSITNGEATELIL